MSEMVAFWAQLLPLICTFLLTPPISYIFSIFLLLGVIRMLVNLMRF